MENQSFKPAWWLPHAHLQTMWPTLCRRRFKKIAIQRERVELPDGDFIDLDWAGEGEGPIVMILHGLEGSIKSSYARGMVAAIQQQGWRSVVMHFRGCSGELNRLPRMYHSGETGDVAYIAAYLQKRAPTVPLAAIGFSLGGNVLLKWLGETQQENPLTAAVAVSVPFDLQKSVSRIERGFSRFYQWYLLRSLRAKLIRKLKKKALPIQVPPLSQLRTISKYDHHVTAPLHGFAGAEDYYVCSSSRAFLKNIHIPTLLLQAKDDPFMTQDVIPMPNELSKSTKLEVSKKGGHVGFVSGRLPWKPRYWLEQRVPMFLQEYI